MLVYKHISKASEKFLEIVEGRRTGALKSLRTSLHKLNKATLNGLEWGRIVTVAGRSGSGKSLFLEQLKRDFCDLNRDQRFCILSFEFEMLSTDQIARNVSGNLGLSTKYLYSGESNSVSDEEYVAIKEESEKVATRPIFYVDDSGTPEDIYNTAIRFAEHTKLKEKNLGLVLTIDHVLLTKGKDSDNEKKIVDNLCKTMIRLKKKFEAEDMKLLIIMASQLNRDIETAERVLNPKLHYPTRADIFGASSIFFSSDYVFVIHKPASVDGMSSSTGYGSKGLPIFNPDNPEQAMIYFHILKERFGEPKILAMLDAFKESKISEYYYSKKETLNDN